MFQDTLQSRAHNGDQAAFREIYNRYSRDVYAVSHTALGTADDARTVVKQVFLQLYRELMRSESDLDLPARLSALTNEEIRITRIAAGNLDPEALLVQYTIASQPAVDTEHTMERIRAHMQQSAVQSKPEEQPAAKAESAAEQQSAAEEAPAQEDAFMQSFSEPQNDRTEAELFDTAPDEDRTAEDSAPETDAASSASEELPPAKKSRRGAAVAGIFLFILLVVFVWLLAGILMDLSILPFYDLGYSLFNEYVFDFFRLP